ncbi:MAG: thioredoxin family protein [Acaryochloris sp. SU_5_25]|nr:thioredoxin family protein [Acaryochloris sp. SU_5_25]
MQKRQVEIFTANCPLCDETVQLVQALACTSCEVSVYNLREDLEKAQQYGVNAVPAIAINGTLVLTGKPNRAQLQAIGIGQPLS